MKLILFVVLSLFLFQCSYAKKNADGIDPSVIINIAKELWDEVIDNQPVVNVTVDYATGFPEGVTQANQLQGWVDTPIRVDGMKLFKVGNGNAVDFRWTLEFTYGGNYQGVGQYLDDVVVIPYRVSVFDFFNLQSQTHISAPINVGNDTHPIAGMQVDVEWKIQAPWETKEGETSYFIQGNGIWKCISNCDDIVNL